MAVAAAVVVRVDELAVAVLARHVDVFVDLAVAVAVDTTFV